MSLDWGISKGRPFGFVTGSPPMNVVEQDDINRLDQHWEWMDKEGTQTSDHPFKNQPKRPQYI